MEGLIKWLEEHYLPCAYKQLFGFECPVCGFQRALIELLKGNFLESFMLYPALIPSLILVVVFISHLLIRSSVSRGILLWTARIDLIIILLAYGWKLAT